MNTAPYFEDGEAEGNVMIVNESINNYPQQVEFIRNDMQCALNMCRCIDAAVRGKLAEKEEQ